MEKGDYFPCEPQQFVIDIAEGTFNPINKQIIYQQCNKHGLPPKFMIDPYTPTNLQRPLPSNVTKTNQIWYLPDILLCQGYFYDNGIIEHRERKSGSKRLEINIEEQMGKYHHLDVPYDIDNYDESVLDVNNIHYDDNLKYSIRLSKNDNKLWQHYNRSFLTTYNTEYWGGGKCNRYDIIFESVYDRTLHGCVTVYMPPAFYFESERMHNNTDELILPPDVVYNGDKNIVDVTPDDDDITFTPKQQSYIESILSFKSQAPEQFALFLVRDCYKSKYHIDAIIRAIFFDMLSSEYKNATSLGGCRRNIPIYKALGWKYCPKNSYNGHYMNKFKYNCSGYGWTDGVVQMARPYKFFITMENSKIKGYSTEKIFNALYSNAIPIYFGDPMITQYLNKNKFIHCNSITNSKIAELRRIDRKLPINEIYDKVKPMVKDDLLKCIKKVKMVDQNEKLYHRMLVEPVFVNNTYKNTIMDL